FLVHGHGLDRGAERSDSSNARSAEIRPMCTSGDVAKLRLHEQFHAERLQVSPQLRGIPHQDRLHSDFSGRFNIDRAIVDKAAPLRRLLREIESKPINAFLRLADPHETRTHENIKAVIKAKSLN